VGVVEEVLPMQVHTEQLNPPPMYYNYVLNPTPMYYNYVLNPYLVLNPSPALKQVLIDQRIARDALRLQFLHTQHTQVGHMAYGILNPPICTY
jgi:hypothetical protein